MSGLIQLQDKFVADIVHAKCNVKPQYGNQRKAIRAAHDRFEVQLKRLDLGEELRHSLADDCYDMAELETNALVRDAWDLPEKA